MATRTLRVCDVNAEHGDADAHVFAVDGQFFTADLCDADSAKLSKAMDPIVAVATPISGRDAIRSANGHADFDPAVVRAWAQRNGKQIGEKGRVPADLVDEWRKATQS